MKKISTYTLLILVFALLAAFVVVQKKSSKEMPMSFKERKGTLVNSEEYKETKLKAETLLSAIAKKPSDIKSKLELAALYIQEARITGDHVYYDAAAMHLANEVLKKDSNNFEALVFKGAIYLSQHHFADGLKIAQQVQKLNPYNAFVYGMLVDANVELGNYDAAVANADKMVSIRPDLRSYSRVSYLREIYGDYAGAIDAMKLAVSAGYPGDESTEWIRVHLAQLYENTGDMQSAEMQYRMTLEERPDYAYAIMGLGRMARASKKYSEAIAYYQKANTLVNDYSIKDELTDLYNLNGDKEKAQTNAKEVIEMLSKDAQSGISDENIGHYADRELALAYLKTNGPDKALDHALMEYNRRPDNIDVNETLAWVYFKKNDLANAHKYISVAMKTNSKNPTLLCRAGLVFAKTGKIEQAKELIQSALTNNPNISEDLKYEAKSLWQTANM